MNDCFSKIKVGDIITVYFTKTNDSYRPSPTNTDYQFSFPVIKINKYGDPEIGLFENQKNIYGFWADPYDNRRIKFILYPEDIKIVKIKKAK